MPDILRVDPESEREQVAPAEGVQGRPRRRAGGAAPRGDPRVRPRDRQHAAACCARRSRTAARSARCAARCATCSATTSRTTDGAHARAVILPAGRPGDPHPRGGDRASAACSPIRCCSPRRRARDPEVIAVAAAHAPAGRALPGQSRPAGGRARRHLPGLQASTSGATSTSAGASSPPSCSARSRARSSSGRAGRLATLAERDLAATAVPAGGRRTSATWSAEYTAGVAALHAGRQRDGRHRGR